MAAAAKTGFFGSYKDVGQGGRFVGGPEKLELISQGVAFDIVDVAFDEHNEHGPRFIAFCKIPNLESGEVEDRKIGFPTGSGVNTRDNMLNEMKTWLDENEGESVKVKLEKPGRAIFIVSADA